MAIPLLSSIMPGKALDCSEDDVMPMLDKYARAPKCTQASMAPAMKIFSYLSDERKVSFSVKGYSVLLKGYGREGEEAMLLDALQSHPGAWGAAHWLIVPRHPQRFESVAVSIRERGLRLDRRSQWGPSGPDEGLDGASSGGPKGTPEGVWLGDSLGEMAAYAGLADIALLGGSFAPTGGQNLIELAACGCPVVMGPHTFNFATSAQAAETLGAAKRVGDMVSAVQAALDWLAQPTQRQQAVQASQALALKHQGAAQRTAQALAPLLS
jgi:3-deoxy-D-manno-octulosonic-acid transferase